MNENYNVRDTEKNRNRDRYKKTDRYRDKDGDTVMEGHIYRRYDKVPDKRKDEEDEYTSDSEDESETEVYSDDDSTTTKKTKICTLKNKTMIYQITDEDEVNTVNSASTTKPDLSQQEADYIHQLSAVRYSYNITLDPLDMASLREEFKGHTVPKEQKDPLMRIRRGLMEFYAQMKNIDKDAKILTWKQGTKTVMLPDNIDNFPKEAVTIASFFEGFNPRRKQGRLYFRIRIHSPTMQNKLYTEMNYWAQLNGQGLQRCIIQSEESTNIGWMVYSSQYTDIEHLHKYLRGYAMKINPSHKFEWGFKLSAITKADEYEDEAKNVRTLWKDRKNHCQYTCKQKNQTWHRQSSHLHLSQKA